MDYKHLCLNCEKADMQRTTKDVTVTEGKFSEVVKKVYGWHCPACGEIEFLSSESNQRYDEALDRVFALDSEEQRKFVLNTRKKLRLTQQQAAHIFGGGIRAFSEYECGKTRPSKALLACLRLLDHHPEQLAELTSV